MFLENILKEKVVSVWGLGYLGYTTILKLQNSGFSVIVYDTNRQQSEAFLSRKYPTREQVVSWSLTGYVPELDHTKIKVARLPKDMFRPAGLHLVAIPEEYKKSGANSVAAQLAGIFSQNVKKKDGKPMIIFESAFIPGHIQRCFSGILDNSGLRCSRDYYLGAMFRTDWSIEAFLSGRDKMPVAGCSAFSLNTILELCSFMKIPVLKLGNIKEAELYVNSANVIQAMVNDFLRQLSLGYPKENIKALSDTIFKNIKLDDCVLNMGTGGTKTTLAIDYLVEGSENPNRMTLLKEFQDINISSVLSYAEYIVRNNYRTASILGITYRGNQKDLILSPSVTLAEYLIKNSLKVWLNEPHCRQEEIRKYVSNAGIIRNIEDAFCTDVLVVASDHNEYKSLTQSRLDSIRKKTRLIIDNYGTWSHLDFGNKIKYHQIGDGKLNISK